MSSAPWLALFAVALGVAVLVYVLPSAIAFKRRHRERRAILALNLLLGWTFAGWVAAFVWSLTSHVEVPAEHLRKEQS